MDHACKSHVQTQYVPTVQAPVLNTIKKTKPKPND